MRQGITIGLLLLLLGGCGGQKSANRPNPSRITVGVAGPLAPGLLTQVQLRQVPSLSNATVTSLQETAVFADPDPRGPCGAKVPVISLTDAVGVAIKADTLRGAAELVTRLPSGAAKKYLDARVANTTPGCPEYQTVTHQHVTQRVLLVRIVQLPKEFQQALAVVTALKVGTSVRAATQIEVRQGDVLARTIIFTNTPMDDVVVRGIASLMGRDLSALDS